MLKDRRLILIILVLAGIGIQFWAGQRVPALNEKALMGGDTELGALGFDVVLQVRADDPITVRALSETVNWLKTNQRGMIFGVLFASTLMLLLSLLKKRSFHNRYANSLLGIVIGAPLGVCVNCAAPIAKGLYSGGARVETTIAAMISSPTLNVIVLTMLISLFPPYMVAIKLGLTLGFILVMIPLLSTLLAKNAVIAPAEAATCPIDLNAHLSNEGNENWLAAGIWLIKSWLGSFWHVFKTTVPLMFLAGFLGALLVTLLPWDYVAKIIPSGTGLLMLATMAVLSLIGVFLPVPIAFDVILVAILLAAGLPVGYAMVLLFTLGIYSIYSFFIVWREISRPMAVGIWAVTFAIGVGAGLIGEKYYQYDAEEKRQLYYAMFGEAAESNGPTVLSIGGDNRGGIVRPELAPPQSPTRHAATGDGLIVEQLDFQAHVGSGTNLFTKHYGKEFGIEEPYSFSVMDYVLSWGRFRGVAAGDVHNDGLPDLLLTSKTGLSLYANYDGERFVRQALDIPRLEELHTVNAAFVDLNNDEWLDIVVATNHSGNHVIYNDEGTFAAEEMVKLPNRDGAFMTGAMGFGDVDNDGDLDAVFGNFSYGWLGIMPNQERTEGMRSSLDALLINDDGKFTARGYSTVAGETMSVLLSDINDDGALDLISANDFDPPDIYLLGDGSGNFNAITNGDGIIPHSGSSTMSIVTADVDNDLVPEIFVAQISGRAGRTQLDMLKVDPRVCIELAGTDYLKPCERIMTIQADFLDARKTQNVDTCLNTDLEFREDCVALLLMLSATRWNNDETLCNQYSDNWAPMSKACKDIMDARISMSESDISRAIPQQGGGNSLFFRTEDGSYEDRAEEYDLQVGGWSWNARFADVDNDEWLDIFIVNGDVASSTREANFFYRGHEGRKFVDATVELGLGSHLETSAYTYVDFDFDGDLDIVSVPEFGPIIIYNNNVSDRNSIAVELRDKVGNSYGVGSKIVIRYGTASERHQMREIQLSGGFESFDAPVAYFGLGEFDTVESIDIQWSTGEKSSIDGPFKGGAKYTIKRLLADTDLEDATANSLRTIPVGRISE